VLAVEPVRLHGADEELRTVRVRARVGHREDAGTGVLAGLPLEGLVGELRPVDRLAARAVARGEVAALAHEPRDDPVERRALEVQRLARPPDALLAGAQRAEVLRGLRRGVREQLE